MSSRSKAINVIPILIFFLFAFSINNNSYGKHHDSGKAENQYQILNYACLREFFG